MPSHLIRRHALPLAAALLVIAASSAQAQFVYEQNANGQLLEQDSCGFNHNASMNNLWTQAERRGTDCHNNPILLDVSNWNFPNYPNSTTASVDIELANAPAGVHLNSSVSAGNVTLGAGATLQVDPNNDGGVTQYPVEFTVAGNTFTNNGTWIAAGAFAPTTIIIPSALTLTGSGVFDVENSATVSGAGILTIAAGQTVTDSGKGTITAKMVNNGTITTAGGLLFLNPPSFTNNNLLSQTSGGTLELNGSAITNTNGTISATGTGLINFTGGVAITGGTLKSSGDMSRTNYLNVEGGGGGATFSNLTLTAGSVLEVGTPANIAGTITNNGGIYVDGFDFNGGVYAKINLDQAASLLGSGYVYLRNGTIEIGTGVALTVGPAQTITYGGTITGSTLVNQGTINADGNYTAINLNTAAITNTGTLEVTGSGTMYFNGGTINNAGGTLYATGSNRISINGANISGGTLKSSGDPTRTNYIEIDGGGSFADLTIATGTTVEVKTPFGLGGTIVNNGKIQIDGFNFNTGQYSSLEIAHNTTVNGTGSINLNRINVADGATLTQGPSHSLIGGGSITGAFVNAGGTITANLTVTGKFTQTSGTIDLDGGTVTPQQGLDLDGGKIVGTGSINGVVRNNTGHVAPGHSPGTITINGDYIQAAKGELDMQIGGGPGSTNYDKLVVNGTATLGGTLNITLINGYKPKVGDVYTLVSATAFKGKFSKVTINGFTGQIDTSTNGVTLTITTASRQLLNVATRLKVLTGDNVLIGGFIITGAEPKKVLIEAIGPSLTKYGVTGALADPILELHKPDSSVVTNDNWKQTQQAAIAATGLAPSNDKESAILATLAPGAYTAIVRGNNNGTGVAIVQAYDQTPAAGELGNIATRGFVDNGDNVMIGGFIIGGGTAGTKASVLIRGIGPSLAKVGITGTLQNPTLELHDANGNVLKSNDNWQTTQAVAIKATGLAPSDARESAILATLAPGSYTAILRGKANTTGVGLVEVYNVAIQ